MAATWARGSFKLLLDQISAVSTAPLPRKWEASPYLHLVVIYPDINQVGGPAPDE